MQGPSGAPLAYGKRTQEYCGLQYTSPARALRQSCADGRIGILRDPFLYKTFWARARELSVKGLRDEERVAMAPTLYYPPLNQRGSSWRAPT